MGFNIEVNLTNVNDHVIFLDMKTLLQFVFTSAWPDSGETWKLSERSQEKKACKCYDVTGEHLKKSRVDDSVQVFHLLAPRCSLVPLVALRGFLIIYLPFLNEPAWCFHGNRRDERSHRIGAIWQNPFIIEKWFYSEIDFEIWELGIFFGESSCGTDMPYEYVIKLCSIYPMKLTRLLLHFNFAFFFLSLPLSQTGFADRTRIGRSLSSHNDVN